MTIITEQELKVRVSESVCKDCHWGSWCPDRKIINEACKCDKVKKALRKERWFIRKVLNGEIMK